MTHFRDIGQDIFYWCLGFNANASLGDVEVEGGKEGEGEEEEGE